MIEQIDIRPETEQDIAEIRELNKLAFGQDTEANLISLLRSGDAFIPELSLVAVCKNNIVGHVLFTRITIADDEGNVYESLALAPMAVSPQLQKQGIGSLLVREGLNRAKLLGHRSVIVVGHEHYYPRFGFVPAEKWKIKCPYEVPASCFMAVELVDSALKNVTGTVRYSKEFDEV